MELAEGKINFTMRATPLISQKKHKYYLRKLGLLKKVLGASALPTLQVAPPLLVGRVICNQFR